MDSSSEFYELNDGEPVSACLHGGGPGVAEGAPHEPAVTEPKRVPFGDVTSQFSEFYAAAIAAAAIAAGDVKSPERSRSRFSPTRPGPTSAAKRLWSTELPPLPKPAGIGSAQRALTALASARPVPQDGPSSPTRHVHRGPSPMEGGQPLPSGPAAGPELGLQRHAWGSAASLHDSNHSSTDLSSSAGLPGPSQDVGTPTKRRAADSLGAAAAAATSLGAGQVEVAQPYARLGGKQMEEDTLMAGTTPFNLRSAMAVAPSPFPHLENQAARRQGPAA